MGWFGLDGDTDMCCWFFNISEGVAIIGCFEVAFACMVIIVSINTDHIVFFLPLTILMLVYCYFFISMKVDPRFCDT